MNSLTPFSNVSGAINTHFYLETKHQVSRRVFEKIDRATSFMMQSGLYRFYNSLAEYDWKLSGQENSSARKNDGDELQAVTMEQFKRPLMLLLSVWGIVVAIFIGEILVSKWNNWQWY